MKRSNKRLVAPAHLRREWFKTQGKPVVNAQKSLPLDPGSEPWQLLRVISGGQIGADIAGVRAAKKAGIPTGGFMPFGFITLFGMKPEYAQEYGMQECAINGYRHRTHENVRHSDGTLRFAYRWNSPGELCTMNAIREQGKPWFDVNPHNPHKPSVAASWIRKNDVKVLNIAGNADPDIEPFVEEYLAELFECLRTG